MALSWQSVWTEWGFGVNYEPLHFRCVTPVPRRIHVVVEMLERHTILSNVVFRIARYLVNRARELLVSFLQVKQNVIAVHPSTIRRGRPMARVL